MAKWIQQEMTRIKWTERIESMTKEIQEMENKNQELVDAIRPWYDQLVNQDQELDRLLDSKLSEAKDRAAHLASIQSALMGRRKAPIAIAIALPKDRVSDLLGCFPELTTEHPFSPSSFQQGQCLSSWKISVREAYIQRTLELINHKKTLDQFWAHLYHLLSSQIYPLLEHKSKMLVEMDTVILNLKTEILNLKLAYPCVRVQQQQKKSWTQTKKKLMPPGAKKPTQQRVIMVATAPLPEKKQQRAPTKPMATPENKESSPQKQSQVDFGGWLQEQEKQVVIDPRQSGMIIIRQKPT